MDDITWKEFEKLVSKLEKALSPIGAAIKSPDKIKDVVTGQLREVDGSIRFRSNNKEILITIECRKRNQRQDITWIEQLATKKQNINADKTIAVSIKGFSKSAHKLAEVNNISLKTLNEINPITITEWLIPKSIVNLFREITLVSLNVDYNDNSTLTSYETNNIADKSFFDKDKNLIVVPTILGQFEDYLSAYRPDILFSAPLDGSSSKELKFKTPIDNNSLLVKVGTNYFSVTELVATIKLSYLHTITDLEQGRHYVYDSDKNQFQVSEFNSSNDKLPFTFRHLADTKNKSISSSLEPKRAKR